MIIKRNKLKKTIINLSVLGSILSISTTTLRFTDDIGFGESLICLSLVIFLFAFPKLTSRASTNSLPSSLIYSFMLLSFLGVCFTVLFLNDVATDKYVNAMFRTTLAYSFAIFNAVIILLLVSDKEDIYFILKRLIQFFNIVNICTFIILFPALISSFISGGRFSGFSKNPNQLGTASAIMPFVAFFLYKAKKIKLPSLLITLITTGILAKAISSDALFYAFLASGFVFAYFLTKNYSIPFKILVFLCFFLIFYVFIIKNLETYIVKTDNEGNQASVRFTLWKHAYQATERSPLVGMGPGSFSGFDHPFQGSEAHNTFLDYLTNTGLIGLAMYILFLNKIVFRLYSMKEYNLIAAFSAIIIFSCFHNVLRHPVFWLFIFLLYGYTSVSQKLKNVSISYNSGI